jgi:hypothetical protein
LRVPPIVSGRLVVGAATIAPLGSWVSAERCTVSRHRPAYVDCDSQLRQNCDVASNSADVSVSSQPSVGVSACGSSTSSTNRARSPSSSVNSAVTSPASTSSGTVAPNAMRTPGSSPRPSHVRETPWPDATSSVSRSGVVRP